MIIATWSIVRGVMQIVAAFALRALIEKEWLLSLSGACSLAFGVILMARPLAGALTVIWIIGTYAIVTGALEMAFAFRLHSLGPAMDRHSAALSAPGH